MKTRNMKDFCISIRGRSTMESFSMGKKMVMEFRYYLMRRSYIRGILSMGKKVGSSMLEIIKLEKNILDS